MARHFHHARHHAHRAAAGWKGSLASAATGAATGVALPYVVSAAPFLQSTGWWTMPAALLLVGHFLKRKNPQIGGALLGIGGMSLYSAFQGSRATAKGYPSSAYADAGGPLSYNDNLRTDAAPSMNTAQAAALLNAPGAMGMVDAGQTMGLYQDTGYAEAGADEAYGLVD
jgi:hypothetical protein